MRFSYKFRHADLRLDMTPLIDVVFLLLIFFMVTSTFVHISGIRVRLPDAESAKLIDKETGLKIDIDARGRYFIDENNTSFERLVEIFVKQKKDTVITISADKQVAFESVMQVWDAARKNGFKEIVVLTTK
ncbi:MAG: biopolymer transporter ExbD [Candidatus Omnitrophica bacterium]|nr:biopolymer transporter ExbD [Candidatus Omnitrophota bacterium]